MPRPEKPLRVGSRLGKYRLERRIGRGAFASVFAATDTLLGLKVALKIPLDSVMSEELLETFRREVKLTMKLDHPNILPIRDATVIDGHLVIVSPLAKRTLDERLGRRIGFETAFDIVGQLIAAVSHAHQRGIIHCDIKPENVLMFDDERIRLADFGIAKAAQRTINGEGTGTVGHMAPEQAMGRPSSRSDVFAIGLIAFRAFAGRWPEYPFDWPLPGAANLRRKAHPELVAIIRKSLAYRARDRYADATKLAAEWQRVQLKAIRYARRGRAARKKR